MTEMKSSGTSHEEEMQRTGHRLRLTAATVVLALIAFVGVLVVPWRSDDHEKENKLIALDDTGSSQLKGRVSVMGNYYYIPSNIQYPEGTLCSEKIGADLPGHDLHQIWWVSTLKGCQNYCKANMKCRCYVWRKSASECWLKDGPCNNWETKDRGDFTSGICRGTQRTCVFNYGTDIPNNDIDVIHGIWGLQCQTLCSSNLDCKCFVFSESMKTCWLKKGPCNNYMKRSGYVSGTCSGGGSCPTNTAQLPYVDNTPQTGVGQFKPKVSVKNDIAYYHGVQEPWGVDCTDDPGNYDKSPDIGHYQKMTRDRCKEYCTFNMDCRCFTYSIITQECWLKNGPCDLAIPIPVAFKNEQEVFRVMRYFQSGVCRGFRQQNCTEQTGYDLPNNDIGKLHRASVSVCQQECKTNLNCNCYTYQAATKTCWLKQGQCNNWEEKSEMTSGLCPGGGSCTL